MQLVRFQLARIGWMIFLFLAWIAVYAVFLQSCSYADPDLGAWGAIAIDDQKNTGGAANNYSTAVEASVAAIAICKHNGGDHCLALLTFHGCAAVIKAHDKFYYGQAPFSPHGERDAIGRALFTYRIGRGDFHVLASTCNFPLQPDHNG